MANPKTFQQLMKLMGLLGEVPGNPEARKVAEQVLGDENKSVNTIRALMHSEATSPAEETFKKRMIDRALRNMGPDEQVGFASGKRKWISRKKAGPPPETKVLPPGPVEDIGKLKQSTSGEVQPKMLGRYDEDFPGGRWEEESARIQSMNAQTKLENFRKYVDRRNMEISDHLQYLEDQRANMHPAHYADMKANLSREMHEMNSKVRRMEKDLPMNPGQIGGDVEDLGAVDRAPEGKQVMGGDSWRPTPSYPNPINWDKLGKIGQTVGPNTPFQPSERPMARREDRGDRDRTALMKQAMNIGGKVLDASGYLPEALPYTLALNALTSGPPPEPGPKRFKTRPRVVNSGDLRGEEWYGR